MTKLSVARAHAYAWVVRLLGLVASALLIGGLTTGCVSDQGKACELEVSEISMVATVSDVPDAVEVEVAFSSGDPDAIGSSLSLCEDERRSLEVNGQPMDSTETYTDSFKYLATLDAPAASYEVKVKLGVNKTEIAAQVQGPPPLSIDSPQPGAELSRTEEATLEWSAGDAGEEIEIELIDDEILCLEDWSLVSEDDGSHVIPPNTIVRSDPDAPDGKCQAEYVFSRTVEGDYPSQLDPAGSLTAFVRRGVRFVSAP